MKNGTVSSTKPNNNKMPWWLGIVIVVVALSALMIGYLGIGTKQPGTPARRAGVLTHTGAAQPFPRNYRVISLTSGKTVPVIRGRHLTVVMLMASWCLYCAYEDKYVWPQVARSVPGMAIDIIDVSTNGGIGNPGPKSPAFTGSDNPGAHISVTGMRQTMLIYAKQFHLNDPNIHVFVDPTGISYWHVTVFPTFLFLNAKGQIVKRLNTAVTISQMQSVLQSLK